MLAAVIQWASARRERLQKVGLALAVGLFAGGIALSLWARPDLVFQLNPLPLLVILLLVNPVGMTLSTVEFRLIGRAAGAGIGWRTALLTIIYSRAAKMLPLPGGFVTRLAALRAHDIPLHTGSLLILVFTGVWGTLAFVYSGLWLVASDQLLVGGAFLLVALCGAAVSAALMMWRVSIPASVLTRVAAVRTGALVAESITFMLALWALGVPAGFEQAAAFVVGAFIGVVVSVVPAGLGIKEGAVALLAPLVGLDAATAFLAAALTRLVGMTWLVIVSGLVYVIKPRESLP